MSNVFNGVPIDNEAAVALDSNIILFIKSDVLYTHNIATNTTSTSPLQNSFPAIPTGLTAWLIGGGHSHIQTTQIEILYSDGMYYFYDYTITNGIPTFVFNRIWTQQKTHAGGGWHWGWLGIDTAINSGEVNTGSLYTKGGSMYLWSGGTNYWLNYSSGQGDITYGNAPKLGEVAYGGTGQPFDGLPHNLDSIFALPNNLTAYAFKGSMWYELSIVSVPNPAGTGVQAVIGGTLVGSGSFGATLVGSGSFGATIPPTPLPDIEIVYSAPADFANFASDVALVTETQYGWNFTKTILTADKMELYTYFATAPGAIPFNYDQLLDLRVTMKNNLALGSGNIFFNVYTVGTAGGWYGTKTTYNGTPALGTNVDIDLVETIIPISDIRTDQILAISIGSNTAQQQVNCDVERVSFTALLPVTNETQRVIVKLQNNFVFVDDKYWDFDQVLNGYTNASLTGGWQLSNFSPNIVAGNFPQAVTANTEVGNAWFINGTFQYYETTDGTTWTATAGQTITFINHLGATPPPGKASNGYAYTGCIGAFTTGAGWGTAKFPATWDVEAGGQLQVVWIGKNSDNFLPLSQLATPNNFTLTDFQSGMFDANATPGSTAVGVFIGSTISTAQQPTAPITADISVISETELTIKRSWELNTTTYLLNPGDTKSVLGQYNDPAFTTTLAPDTFTGTKDLVVVVEPCPSPIQLLFSGGFINTITASGAYHINVNAPPVGITYVWTANYYDVNNILISAVAGAGTTGTQSNFTIDLLTIPAAAEYVFYTCTSNEGVSAVISIVLIRAAAATPFVLDFQNQSAQIVVDATYSVTPNPVDTNTTYAYTATYNNEFDASLGNVLGAVASGPSSSFNFVDANMPIGTKYINYTCNATGGNQGGETARLSISIIPQIPPSPQSFELQFNGGAYPVNITSNGNYSVVPFPTESALIITYTYTANYFEGTTDLGPVVGFDVTGQSSSFPFTFATMPSGATYIKYVCSASGTGLQNGETAESIIGLVSPSGGGFSGDIDLNRSISGSIIFNQYNSEDSLKLLTGDRLTGLTMTLTDSYGDTLYSPVPVYYELNVRSSNSG